MKPRVATTSQYRNRSVGPWVARKARFTESIRFRKATNAKRANRADPMPMTLLRRSPFSVRRSRAFSSSRFVISALLFHVPDDEDESELAHRDHERDDDVQKEDDESGPRLADQSMIAMITTRKSGNATTTVTNDSASIPSASIFFRISSRSSFSNCSAFTRKYGLSWPPLVEVVTTPCRKSENFEDGERCAAFRI